MNPDHTKQPENDSPSVLRGGGWDFYQPRYWDYRSNQNDNVGFRCTLTGRLPRV